MAHPSADILIEPKNPALANRLSKLLEARGLSPRSLSLKAGLSADAIRNISTGRAASPRVSTLQRLADALEVPLSALTVGFSGEEPAEPTMPFPNPPTQLREGVVDIFEYDLRRRIAGAGGDIKAGRQPSTAWSAPTDLLGGIAQTDLAIVRLPGDTLAPEIAPGERLLVDITATLPSPPGVYVIFDGIGHSIARLAVVGGREARRVRISTARGDEEQLLEDVEIVGRVIARLWSRV